MSPSIWHRLRHPRIAIHQGLPSADEQLSMRAGEQAKSVSGITKSQMLEYLDSIPHHSANSSRSSRQNHLYEGLTIIDGKAQALLSFNSFLLAIVGIYFGTIQSIRDEILLLIPFVLTVIASGTSCLLCLDVVWIHWMTTEDMRNAKSSNPKDADEQFLDLLMLRDERTRTYRFAWLLSFASVAAIIVGVILAIFIDLI